MAATITANRFSVEEFFPPGLLDEITDIRVHRPRVISQEAKARKKRARLTRDGKLVLVALDHPARGVTRIRRDELAMADRHQLLARVRRVLSDPELDGVVATADVLEELLILNYLERKRTGKEFLNDRVLVGSMNRGGLAGTAFEMEDTFTAIGAERLSELRCDGGKMLFRLDPDEPACGRTILACATALNALRRHRLAAFLEPLGVARQGESYQAVKDASTLARQCGIAAGLGDSSAHVWLKVPYCEDFARVCVATTLPILLLGGPARETSMETLQDFAAGFAAGPRVRGAIIGRNLLFPANDEDPLPVCRALTAMVHRGATLQDASRLLKEPVAAAPPGSRARASQRKRK